MFLVALLPLIGAHAAETGASKRSGYAPLIAPADTLGIDAGTVTEGATGEPLFLSAGLEMTGAHWRLKAREAVVDGSLSAPVRIVLRGAPQAPARAWLQRRNRITLAPGALDRAVATFYAEGARIDYRRAPERLIVSGSALIEEDGKTLRGERLVYDLERETLRAEGDERVRITLDPEAVDEAL
ncbi:MAG: hypothetical protein AAGI15_13965 [Pseudomonadota bacterium]